ncbi:MAG: hypothetical protein GX443_00395 [Deltaproteobacteria bacterium]|nr:hypothetical protein [Deltaproteobacteria bacterium]
MTILRIAWRNLGRNPKRSLLSLEVVALAQTTLMFVNGLMAGSHDQMLQTITGPMLGNVQVHHPRWEEERSIDLTIGRLTAVRSQIAPLPSVETILPRIYAPALAASGEKKDEPARAEPAMTLGMEIVAESEKGGLLESLPDQAHPHGNRVVVGRILANRLHLVQGQQLAVIGQDVDGFPVSDLFTIRAIMESPVDLVKTRGVVMSRETAAELMRLLDQAHEIVIWGSSIAGADAPGR